MCLARLANRHARMRPYVHMYIHSITYKHTCLVHVRLYIKTEKNGCADGQKKHTYRRKTFINIDRRNMYKRIDRQPRDIPADILTDKRMYLFCNTDRRASRQTDRRYAGE